MRTPRFEIAVACLLGLSGVFVVSTPVGAQTKAAADKIPVTTKSEEARKLYLQGRDLAEKLQATDGRSFFDQAVAKDKDFALAYVGLANSSGTFKEFADALARAAALAGQVSEGERHLILGLDAGLKGNAAGQESHYAELVRLFPNDERAHNLMGNLSFGRQDYGSAAKHYTRATEINPAFSPAYNLLGYTYRSLEKYADAERAFKKYIELIPKDPNPYDSYAELLMKMGRFDESIAMYQKALALDPNFVASYVGIGNDHIFKGHPDQARATFTRLSSVARNTGERRQAHFWTAVAYVHEGATDKAIEAIKQGSALAEADKDLASISGDLVQIGDILLEAGRSDQALASYTEAVAVMDKAQVPDEVKQVTRRNHLFEEGRVAAAKSDLALARTKLAEYGKQVAVSKQPFEVRQQHELAGVIAVADKQYATAAEELKRANQQDPRVLYLTAVALQGAGNAAQARAFATKAAQFNGLNVNYGFVRAKAQRMGAS